MTEQKQSSAIFELANRLLAFLDRCSRQQTWPCLVLLVAILISVFCWVPYYPAVSDFIKTPYGEAKTWWLEHPFKAVPVEHFLPLSERHIGFNAGIASHLDKMTYRAFLPLLNQIAPFGIWTLFLTCHIGAFAILWFTYRIVSNQVGDKVSGALASWAVAACYAGQYGFHDFYFGDAAAVGMLVAAMFSRNWILTFLLIFFAGFADERVVASAPLVLLFHFLRDWEPEKLHSNFTNLLFMILKKGSSVIAGVVTYAIVRVLITLFTGEKSGTSMLASIDILRAHLYNNYPQLIFKVFEFLWILPIIFIVEFGSQSSTKKIVAILFGLAFAVAIFPAMVVWDIDRSLFYFLPGILLAICFLSVSLKNLRLILLAILFANFIWLYPSNSALRKIDHFVSSFIVLEKQ